MIHEEAKRRRLLSLQDAVDQTTAYFGFGVTEIEVGDEVFEVRPKVLWSPEQIAAMAELDEWVKTLDHDEVEARNPITNELVVRPDGTVVIDRVVSIPHRRNGKPVKPSYEDRYLAALFGDERAARFQQAGGTYGLVTMILSQMDDQFAQWRRNREKGDSKSR